MERYGIPSTQQAPTTPPSIIKTVSPSVLKYPANLLPQPEAVGYLLFFGFIRRHVN
jgi:hypothetical protein